MIGELIDNRVGVLIVVGAETLRVAHRATQTLPIVAIDLETDPVRSGLAASIRRPGGNITGLFLDQPTLAEKWLELLLEIAPQVKRVILHWDPSSGTDQLDVAKAAATAKGIEAIVLEMGTYRNFDEAFVVGVMPTGVIQLTSPGFSALAESFAAAAAKHRLPSIMFLKVYAQAGALMSYGPNQEDYFPRAIAVADKILRGEKASEMPIEHPTRLELVVNLKTAKALGITVPPSLLARANEVIE
jgi:putative ABC transport system substrate-binding protein